MSRRKHYNLTPHEIPSPFGKIEYSVTEDEDVTALFALDPLNLLLTYDAFSYKLYKKNSSKLSKIKDMISFEQVTISRNAVDRKVDFAYNALGTPIDNNIIKNNFTNDNVVVRVNNLTGIDLSPSTRFVINNSTEVNVDYDSLPDSSKDALSLDLANMTKGNLNGHTKTGTIKEIKLNNKDVKIINFTDYYLKNLREGDYVYRVNIGFTAKS